MDAFSRITGFGDYQINENSLIAHPNEEAPKPVFGHGGQREKGTEFVGFLKTPATDVWTLSEHYLMNPSNPKLFPRLSQIAALYQQWCPHGLILRFESTCSESVSTTTTSMSIPSLIASTNYDVNAERPINAKQQLNQYFATSSRVNKDSMHPIECDPKQRPTEILYTWNNGQGTKDQNLSNLGDVVIAFQGGQSTNQVAFTAYKVYVEFDIEFLKSRVRSGPEFEDFYKLTVPSTGLPFGSAFVMDDISTEYNFPQIPYTVSGNTIVFDPNYDGDVLVDMMVNYTAGTVSALDFTLTGGATALLYFMDDTDSKVQNLTETSIYSWCIQAIRISGGGTITVSNITATAWNHGSLVISSL
jgi:hypothetical protein